MGQTSNKLLVVEDDPGLQDQLRWCFDRYEVIVAGDRANALDQVRHHQPPVVTLDLGLPPDADGISEGLLTLEEIVAQSPDTKVIVVTGQNDRENAVRAVGSASPRKVTTTAPLAFCFSASAMPVATGRMPPWTPFE